MQIEWKTKILKNSRELKKKLYTNALAGENWKNKIIKNMLKMHEWVFFQTEHIF